MAAATDKRTIYTAGTFGDRPSAPMTVRAHVLSGAERHLEEALGVFEGLGERGLCDDLNQLIEQVMERMTAEQEGAAA